MRDADVVGNGRTGGISGGGKSEPKPTIEVGLRLTRAKDGQTYKVTGVDRATGYIIVAPEAGGEDTRTKALKGDGGPNVVPVFWKNWQPA